jgi:hypothetical protein
VSERLTSRLCDEIDALCARVGELLILWGVDAGEIAEVHAAKLLGLGTDIVAMRERLHEGRKAVAAVMRGERPNVVSHVCDRRHSAD